MVDDKKYEDLRNFEVEITDSENRTYELLPEFVYLPATLGNIVKKQTSKGPRVRFEFHLTGQYDGRRAWGAVPLHKTVSEKADLYTWIGMLLGRTLEVGEKIKLGDFIGKAYEICVENEVVGDKTYQNIRKIRKGKEAVEKVIEEKEIKPKPETKSTPEAKPTVEKNKDTSAPDGDDVDLPF